MTDNSEWEIPPEEGCSTNPQVNLRELHEYIMGELASVDGEAVEMAARPQLMHLKDHHDVNMTVADLILDGTVEQMIKATNGDMFFTMSGPSNETGREGIHMIVDQFIGEAVSLGRALLSGETTWEEVRAQASEHDAPASAEEAIAQLLKALEGRADVQLVTNADEFLEMLKPGVTPSHIDDLLGSPKMEDGEG